jgi:glycosyltransferase involved in cell wall biosynthesis
MANAAIYLHPNGYDTRGPALMGRHSAGESFLRGFMRHADVDGFHFWNVAGRPQAELDALIAQIHPPTKPITWHGQHHRARLADPGVLNMPIPDLPLEAWHRRAVGSRTYSICGVTHTTATANIMRLLPDMLIAPTEAHDALICTSKAVRDSVETQLDGVREYMRAEYGPRRRPEPQRATIPLGVNAEDFTTSPEDRKAWRARLDIPDDAVVALYVGRFNVREKMNPALMAMALERAAISTGQPIYWVNSGWGESTDIEAHYHATTRAMCPAVHYRNVDGRPPDVRFSIWSVADFFISFSDNIQETFGLTPVEAMAAGLPCVVTDWNGYRDTVRHGEDGFRIPTIAPPAGYGHDLSYAYSNGWMNYPNYVGAAGQYTAMDLGEAAAAISALVLDPDLRRRLGQQARVQARQVFDWSAIIPQYQALWGELDARRRAAEPEAEDRVNPFRPDPFTLFQGYPTRRITVQDRIVLTPGLEWPAIEALLSQPLATYSSHNRPTMSEVEAVVGWLSERPDAVVRELVQAVKPQRRAVILRGLLWLARYGVISLVAAE